MVGENIRHARVAQQRSLSDVAKKAKISIATLSRIENEKQTLELGLFLTLAKVLDRTPNDLLGNAAEDDSGRIDPLVKKIASFETSERTQLWRELAASRRIQKSSRNRRLQVRQLSQQVEELLAQVDFMRDELEAVAKRLRRPAPSR
jgi:transcriptional regulator with XRE-family HTH domain